MGWESGDYNPATGPIRSNDIVPPALPGPAPATTPTKQFPPKAYFPPELPSAQDLYVQSSEYGQAIPIVYGTAKVAGNIIERGTTIQVQSIPADGSIPTDHPWDPWALSVYGPGMYQIGQVVQACWEPDIFYLCIQGGTTAAGGGDFSRGVYPTDTATDGSIIWKRIGPTWLSQLAIAFCEGPIAGARKGWQDKGNYAAWNGDPVGVPRLTWTGTDCATLVVGQQPQSRPSWANTAEWNYGDTYANTAVLYWWSRGRQSNKDPNLSLEIQGLCRQGSGDDANPADIVNDLVTHARRGCGWSSSRLFASSLDTSAASWRTYCTAVGALFSWVLDSQRSAADAITQLLEATQTDCYTSGGQLRFVPRCDQAITANGVTFTPSVAPLYALGPDDFLSAIGVSRVSATDTYNSKPVEYYERSSDYVQITVDDPDMADIEVRPGLKRAGAFSPKLVMTQSYAVGLSRVLAQRSLYVRNSYTAQVGWRYLLVEPTDTLTLTDPVLQLSNAGVRVTAFEEELSSDGASTITLTCEDYPAAAHYAAQYQTQAGDGFNPSLANSFDSMVVGAGQIAAVTSSTLTSPASDNLWPNPTSEIDPPTGADTGGAEFGYRYNAGAGAYAGSWVRQVSGGASSETQLRAEVPCAPGDAFYIEAMARRTVGAGAVGATLYYYDASGNSLAFTVTGGPHFVAGATWEKSYVSAIAPAGTVKVVLYLFAQAGTTGQFDAIYARRCVTGSIVSNDAIGAAQTQSRYGVVWSGYPYTGPGSLQMGVRGFGFNSISLNGAGTTEIYEGIIDVTPPATPAGASLLAVSMQGTYTTDSPVALGSRWYSIDTGNALTMQQTGRSGNQIRFKAYSSTGAAVDLTYAGWGFNIRVDYIFG